jgi:hypothetical protein
MWAEFNMMEGRLMNTVYILRHVHNVSRTDVSFLLPNRQVATDFQAAGVWPSG